MDLIIIEAPGKLRRIYELSAQAGLQTRVIATLGHLFDNPKKVTQRAIARSDGEYIEPLRAAIRPDVLRRLEHEISSCPGRILIATDVDREGHVIADDIDQHCSRLGIKNPIYRMKLSSLDLPAFKEALLELTPLNPMDAAPGHARRITDRLITENWSDFANYLPVGRVQTAALSMIEQDHIPLQVVSRNLAAETGGAYQCRIAPPSGMSPADLIKALDNTDPLPLARSATELLHDAPTGDDCIMAISGELAMTITDAAKLLQDMYEQGVISYHRSMGRGYSDTTRSEISRWAIGRGILLCKEENLPRADQPSVHESVHVLQWDRVDIAKPLALQRSKQDAALAVIARMNVSSGILVQRDYADTSSLAHISNSVEASRQQRVLLPWPAAKAQSIHTLQADQALFRALSKKDIGTASTRPLLVDKLLHPSPQSTYLTPDLKLTARGQAILKQSPQSLRDLATTREIEATLSQPSPHLAGLIDRALHLVVSGNDDELSKVLAELEDQTEQAPSYKRRMR